MDAGGFAEKRRYRRCKIEAAAVVHDGRKHQFEKTAEIGEGGMLLRVSKPLASGELIEVQLILPSQRFIAAKGEVIYGIESGGKIYAGIRFLSLSEQSQAFIREFVEGKQS